MDTTGLQGEWHTLQGNCEQYERHALTIKLAAVAITVAAPAFGWTWLATGALLLVLWLQEGIFRTSQARLADRLLRIERQLADGGGNAAPRLHIEWESGRRGTVGLLAEYAVHAARPTVAYPYVVLIVLSGVVAMGR